MAKMLRSLQREQKKHVSGEPDNECGQVPPVTSPTITRETVLQDSPNRLTRRYKCPIFCYSFIYPILCFINYLLFFSNVKQFSLLMEEETSAQPMRCVLGEGTSAQPMHSLMGEGTSTPCKTQGKTTKTTAKKLMPRKKKTT
jgi:hypothetical protein